MNRLAAAAERAQRRPQRRIQRQHGRRRHAGRFWGGHGGRGRGGGGGTDESGGDAGARPPPIHASNQAPIQLRLRLTNHGPAPADVAVEDFDSALGNFVVQPEMITVKPGESVEAEPMISRLGCRTPSSRSP